MGDQYGEQDDLYLWRLVSQHADAEAFAVLHKRFSKKLYLLAHQKTGNGDVSEDLVQDLFIALWTGREHISIEKGVAAYLFSALKNRIISHLRKEMVRSAMPLDTTAPHLLAAYAHNNVEEKISFDELQDQYEYHFRSLPEKSRQAFELSRSGLTNREIAGQMNIVEKTVEFHISKCLRILKSNITYLVLLMSFLVQRIAAF